MKKVKLNNLKLRVFVVLLSLIIISIWVYWSNISIQTTQIRIESSQIPDEFHGYKIVQISDLHNAEFGEKQSKLLDKVKNASPDIIVITGDLIDSSHTDVEVAMAFVRGAVKIAPVYYVTGNHEAWTNEYDVLEEQLKQSGVSILNDQGVNLQRKSDRIRLLGVNDPSFAPNRERYGNSIATMGETLQSINSEEDNSYTILLSHRPELFHTYVENHIDLVFSGHAHGGQVRIPLLGGIVAPNQGFFPKYTEGLYEFEQTKMVVSRGLGNSIIPIRFHNRPELIVVTLAAEQN